MSDNIQRTIIQIENQYGSKQIIGIKSSWKQILIKNIIEKIIG